MHLPAFADRPPDARSYTARLAVGCQPGHAAGETLHLLQELRPRVDDAIRARPCHAHYEGYHAEAAGGNKLAVQLQLRADSHVEALTSVCDILREVVALVDEHAPGVDLASVALVFKALPLRP